MKLGICAYYVPMETTQEINQMNYTITTEEVAEERINNWSDRKADATIRKHTNITVTDSNGKLVAKWNGSCPLRTNHGGYRSSSVNRIQVLPSADFPYPLNTDVRPVKNEEGKRVGFKVILKDGTVITGKNPKAVWANLLNDQFGI
tara:strand:+ start:1044 stop:1481 length:438 start_codon:yes stop_codon:yes gene_type:complete